MPSRKEKQRMSAAERKREQRAKAMANMTEEQKMAHRKKKVRDGHSYENARWQELTKTKKLNLKPKRLNALHNIVSESKVIMINQYRSCQMYL